MKFSTTQIKVKSSWLDWRQPIFEKITYEHFYVYVNLYRFRTHQEQEQDTFITSLGFLRKETGYSTEKVYNLLRDLHKHHIIKVDVSRWDYFIDKSRKGKKVKYIDNAIFICYTLDKPNLDRVWNNAKSKYEDQRVTDDDYYININVEMIDHYRQIHKEIKNSRLKPDRLITFYCILNKYNNNPDKKSSTSIWKMAEAIGFSKTHVNNMIEEMNLNGLLSSRKVKTSMNRDGFEHVVAQNTKAVKELKREVKHAPNTYQKGLKQNKVDDKDKENKKPKPLGVPGNSSDDVSEKYSKPYNPFEDVDDDVTNDTNELEWGQSPSGYEKDEEQIIGGIN